MGPDMMKCWSESEVKKWEQRGLNTEYKGIIPLYNKLTVLWLLVGVLFCYLILQLLQLGLLKKNMSGFFQSSVSWGKWNTISLSLTKKSTQLMWQNNIGHVNKSQAVNRAAWTLEESF